MFQFQTGSIKSQIQESFARQGITFQFQTGSIKSEDCIDHRGMYNWFQFQTGSIKRDLSELTEWVLKKFQFQTGSIKSCHALRVMRHVYGFNSKLVRLKGIRMVYVVYSERFQFQTGSIKSVNPPKALQMLSARGFQFQTGSIKRVEDISQSTAEYRFNSKLVRLKAKIVTPALASGVAVSIPNWFD